VSVLSSRTRGIIQEVIYYRLNESEGCVAGTVHIDEICDEFPNLPREDITNAIDNVNIPEKGAQGDIPLGWDDNDLTMVIFAEEALLRSYYDLVDEEAF